MRIFTGHSLFLDFYVVVRVGKLIKIIKNYFMCMLMATYVAGFDLATKVQAFEYHSTYL